MTKSQAHVEEFDRVIAMLDRFAAQINDCTADLAAAPDQETIDAVVDVMRPVSEDTRRWGIALRPVGERLFWALVDGKQRGPWQGAVRSGSVFGPSLLVELVEQKFTWSNGITCDLDGDHRVLWHSGGILPA